MGGKSSKHRSSRRNSSSRSNSQQWSHYGYPESPYTQSRSTPQYEYAPPTPSYGGTQAPETRKRLERKYSRIDDNYNSLDQVLLQSYCKTLLALHSQYETYFYALILFIGYWSISSCWPGVLESYRWYRFHKEQWVDRFSLALAIRCSCIGFLNSMCTC